MVQRTRRLVFALAAAAVLVFVASWLAWPRSAITRENAAKITIGMTLTEVERILGGAPRDESTGQPKVDMDEDGPDGEQCRWSNRQLFLWTSGAEVNRSPTRRQWNADSVTVWVAFDSQERVTECHAFPMRRESLIDMVRRWLHL
jgi:hypothetical protein